MLCPVKKRENKQQTSLKWSIYSNLSLCLLIVPHLSNTSQLAHPPNAVHIAFPQSMMFQALNQLHHQPLWHRTTPVASGLCLKALVAWTRKSTKKITPDSTLTMYLVDIYIVNIQLILGVQWMVLVSSFRVWQENSDCEVILGGFVREFMLRSYGFISRDHPKRIAGIQKLTLLSLRCF